MLIRTITGVHDDSDAHRHQHRDGHVAPRVVRFLTDRSRRAYAEEARQRREVMARAFYRVPMDHVFVPTNENPVEPLLALFARRVKV